MRSPSSSRGAVEGGAAEILQRYLERLAELGLDCRLAAPLIVDLEGEALSVERLLVHYETARTIRVAMEANGSFCRVTKPASPRCRWSSQTSCKRMGFVRTVAGDR